MLTQRFRFDFKPGVIITLTVQGKSKLMEGALSLDFPWTVTEYDDAYLMHLFIEWSTTS